MLDKPSMPYFRGGRMGLSKGQMAQLAGEEGRLYYARTQRVLPAQTGKSTKVGVGRHQGAAVFDCYGGVLGIGDQFPRGARFPTQSLEYAHVVGAWTNYSRRGAFHKRTQKCKGSVQSGRWGKSPGIGHYAYKAGQDEQRQSKWFGPRRQAGDPGRIFGVLRSGVLNVCIYENIYVGQEHSELPIFTPKSGLVILHIQCSRPVQINSGLGTNSSHSH